MLRSSPDHLRFRILKGYLRMTEEELVAKIRECNRKYWEEEDSSDLSDIEYDNLMRELAKINPSHPILSELHTPKTGGNGIKVHHARPMLSLDKAYSLNEVIDWAKKYCRSESEQLLVQPKYDGISAVWNGSVLATRGDGYDGEDISDKAVLIELETLSGKMPLASCSTPIRGEIVIRKDDFQTIYPKIVGRNGLPYKNPRNAVAGIMGLKDVSPMVKQGAKLSLIDYNSHSCTAEYGTLRAKWESMKEKIMSLPYPMDGIVIKLADEEYSESLGATSHHPRGQIAFKFTNQRKHSVIRNVIWSFGKNSLTPVAEFDPVEIGGTTIRNATLHNLQNVLDKDIQIGDSVEVERAGDVIPWIAEVHPGTDRKPCVITRCPSCGSELIRELPELRCINPECEETCIQRLLAAIRVLEISGVGESNVRRMVRSLHIRHLSGLFEIGELEWRQLEGFGAAAARNLYRQVQNARNAPDWKLLTALNIKGIGPNIAKSLLEKLPFAELRNASVETLSSINGIGPERASLLKNELERQKDSIDDLLKIRNAPEPEQDLFGGF